MLTTATTWGGDQWIEKIVEVYRGFDISGKIERLSGDKTVLTQKLKEGLCVKS